MDITRIREELVARAICASPDLLSDEECRQLYSEYQDQEETKEEPSKDLAQLLEELDKVQVTAASTQEPAEEEEEYDEKDDDDVKVYWNRPPTHSEWIQLSTV